MLIALQQTSRATQYSPLHSSVYNLTKGGRLIQLPGAHKTAAVLAWDGVVVPVSLHMLALIESPCGSGSSAAESLI